MGSGHYAGVLRLLRAVDYLVLRGVDRKHGEFQHTSRIVVLGEVIASRGIGGKTLDVGVERSVVQGTGVDSLGVVVEVVAVGAMQQLVKREVAAHERHPREEKFTQVGSWQTRDIGKLKRWLAGSEESSDQCVGDSSVRGTSG